MSEPAVFLERSGLVSVRVHPLVVISILEQYTRRDVVGDRPVRSVLGTCGRRVQSSGAATRPTRLSFAGTLLGSISGGVLEVTNCFGVPCTERDGVLEVRSFSRFVEHRLQRACRRMRCR